MNAKRMILAAALSAASFGRADDPIRLVYVGADNGSWAAENAWSNAVTSAMGGWQDGAIAVIPGKSLEIPSDVRAHGLEFTAIPVSLTGAGKLTLGAGGLSASIVFKEGDGWKNSYIKNEGGVHLEANQTWYLKFYGTLQIGNYNCPLTAEPDVTWKVGGSAELRGAAKGRLTSDVTMIVGDAVTLTLDDSYRYGFGAPKLVFEGKNVKMSFGNQYQSPVLGDNCAHAVALRSGATLAFNAANPGYFEVPELKVEGDGDAKLSRFTGGVVQLAPGETVVDVADGHTLVLDAVLTNSSASTTLVKRGAGVLTVTQSEEPVDIRVEAGTLQFASQGYRHYRFKIDAVYNPESWGVQISEFKLLNGETVVAGGTASYDETTKVLDYGTGRADCWTHETPAKALDENLNTKWVDQRVAADQIASKGDKVWVQVDYENPVRITGYSWATANDAGPDDASQSCRDPSAWRLLASNDGENWVELDRRENMGPYADRRSWVGTFAADSGLSADAKLGHIVVEEGGTLDLRTFTAATLASGSVENRGGTILTAAGEQKARAVAVLGGTLSRGPATFGGKFFRVTLMGNRTSGWEYTSIAEFSLYAADGTRVNKGTFTDKSASAATVGDLAAGEVWLDANGGNVRGEVANAFDGDAETMFFVTKVKPSPDKPIVFAFRLPDEAARVAGYTFTTGADNWNNESWYQRNNPSVWKVEGSFDGATWHVLDEVSVKLTTPNAPGTEYNGGVPYAVTSWDDPAAGEEYPFDADAAVSVAPGATLDLRSEKMVLDHLAVDCRTGGGTISRLTPAPNGTLDLTVENPKAVREGFVVPLTIGTVADAKNFASWTVRVNGVRKRNRKLVYEDGKLLIRGFGFAVIIR